MIENFLLENIQAYKSFFGIPPRTLWLNPEEFREIFNETYAHLSTYSPASLPTHQFMSIMARSGEPRLHFLGVDIYPDENKKRGGTPLIPGMVMESIINFLTDDQLKDFSENNNVIELLYGLSQEQVVLLLTDPNESARELGKLLYKKKGFRELL